MQVLIRCFFLLVLSGNFFAPLFGGIGDTLFFVDFEDQQIPQGWLNLDLDSLPGVNNRPGAWYPAVDPESTIPGDTNHVITASSWFNIPGQANNWLVLDSFTIRDTLSFLFWNSAPFEGPVYMDGYQVMLSLTGSHPDSFQTQLLRVAEGIDATATPGPGEIHPVFRNGKGVLSHWEVDLSPWMGQTVWIAFVHDSRDDNRILLDDIGVHRRPERDIAVTEAGFSTEYPLIPLPQVGQITFSGKYANPGWSNSPSGKLFLEVSHEGIIQVTDSVSIRSLAPQEEDSVDFLATYNPVLTGDHRITVYSKKWPADTCPGNDTLFSFLKVTDSVFGRDNGILNGEISVGAPGGVLVNRFDFSTSDTLTGLNIYMANPYPGDSLSLVVYAYAPSGPAGILYHGASWNVNTSAPGWQFIPVPGGLGLPAGSYLIGIEEGSQGHSGLGTASGKLSSRGSWIRGGNLWVKAGEFGARGVLMLRAVLGTPGSTISVEDKLPQTHWRAFPNPSAGNFRVDCGNCRNPEEAILDILDLNGNTVSAEIERVRGTVAVNIPHPTGGIYFLRIRTENGYQVIPLMVK